MGWDFANDEIDFGISVLKDRDEDAEVLFLFLFLQKNTIDI